MAFGLPSPAELASACFVKVLHCIHILQITKVGRTHNFTSCWSKAITISLLPFIPFLQSCIVYSSILGSSSSGGQECCGHLLHQLSCGRHHFKRIVVDFAVNIGLSSIHGHRTGDHSTSAHARVGGG